MALTSNGSTTVSGGAVSSVALTFDNALVEGDVYMFQVDAIVTTGVVLSLFVNSDTTDANYERGQATSSGGQNVASEPLKISPTTSGVASIRGACGLLNGKPWYVAQSVEEDSVTRARITGCINNSESTFTGFTLQTASGSYIANDTTIKCWPVTDLAVVADVTVSGGAVTTLDTGAFTALTEGKQYVFFTSYQRTGTGTGAGSLYINGATTASAYRRGIVSDTSAADASKTGTLTPDTTSGNVGVAFGQCGVLNSTPFFSYLFVEEEATAVEAGLQSVYHTTETNFDQLQLTATDASSIDNGSRILILEFEAP